MKKILSNIIAIALLTIIIVLPIVITISLYSSGLAYLGINYEKTSTLVLFVIISSILGGILELFFKTLVQISADMNMINPIQTKYFKLLFDLITSMLSLLIVDSFMEKITVSIRIVLLFSLFITGISYFISNDKEDMSEEKVDLVLENEIQSLLIENNVLDTINILRKEYPELSLSQIRKLVQQINKESN